MKKHPCTGRIGLQLLCVLAATAGFVRAADAPVSAPPPAATRPARAPAGSTPPMPPVPVPAAVAIPRPTADELARLNAAVENFIATDTSPAKPLLEKYRSLLQVQPPRPNSAIAPSLNLGFMTKHNTNLDVAKHGDVDILFLGDSITDFWRNAGPGDNPPKAGKAVFDEYYGSLKTANFGISGDTTQGVLWRLLNGEGQGFQPKVVMLMIGTNNAASSSVVNNTPAEIAEGVGAIVLQLRQDFPAAKILLLGIFPRNAPDSAARRAALAVNPIIARLDDRQNVFYLDIGAKFLDAAGNIPADVMDDQLHPSAKGYRIWAEAVKEPLANLLKGAAP